MAETIPGTPTRDVVLVTGISGSGKSVALHALEDAGYFCVDNLPPQLLREFIRLEQERGTGRIAVAVDVRTTRALPELATLVQQLHGEGVRIRPLFLDADTDALMRRFSETRRPHPLANAAAETPAGEEQRALLDAIKLERDLLGPLRDASTVIDTSQLRPAQLRSWVRDLVGGVAASLTLVFESFAYKHGVPLDADWVFDVRMLPNPYYLRELRPLTGRDAAVAAYLDQQPESAEMLGQIEAFLRRWLPSMEGDQRAFVTVAIGCTGGQHRSVYMVERLAWAFASRGATLKRHRELDAAD
ncbi:MAG: RNase adapter RapZ [Aquabacterium sp.]